MQTPTIERLEAIAARIGKRLNKQLHIEKGSRTNGIAWKLTSETGSYVLLSARTKTDLECSMFAYIAGMDDMAGHISELADKMARG